MCPWPWPRALCPRLHLCYKTYLKKLATLQNKAVKIVGNGTRNDRATPYYAKLKILKLQDLVKLETEDLFTTINRDNFHLLFEIILQRLIIFVLNLPELPPHIIFLYLFLKL